MSTKKRTVRKKPVKLAAAIEAMPPEAVAPLSTSDLWDIGRIKAETEWVKREMELVAKLKRMAEAEREVSNKLIRRARVTATIGFGVAAIAIAVAVARSV